MGNHFFVTKRYFFSSAQVEELLAREKHRIRSPNETQYESTLVHGEVALIVIKDWRKDNGASRHEVVDDAWCDPSIGRLTRACYFTIKIRTNKYPAHRCDNGRSFHDSFEAAIEAINFQELWSQIREARSKKPDPRSTCHACVTPIQPRSFFQTHGFSDAGGFSSLPGDN